eukprot:scaffold2718_cov248-Pinguiococcus_pyrenoidosus.AAC.1
MRNTARASGPNYRRSAASKWWTWTSRRVGLSHSWAAKVIRWRKYARICVFDGKPVSIRVPHP